MDAAKKEIEEIIDENYFDDRELAECVIFEINDLARMDMKTFYTDIKKREKAIKDEEAKEKRRKQFLELKNEFPDE